MAAGHTDADGFSLPHGSIYPVLVALGVSLFAVGIVTNLVFLGVGAVVLAASLIGWFREDYAWYNQKIGTGAEPAKLGAILFMSSEVFLFGALFATYFTLMGNTPGAWPDQEVHLPLLQAGIFSAILIGSSFTLTKAERLLAKDDHKGFEKWLLITIVMGVVFLLGQVYEYRELLSHGFTLDSSKFSSMFFMITGTHGLHVMGGLLVLLVVYIRAKKGQFDSKRHVLPQTAGWYWHFVDVIWILVFFMLYVFTQI